MHSLLKAVVGCAFLGGVQGAVVGGANPTITPALSASDVPDA